ncbi:MAG TPA: NADH-quinone oxidoreductase subunit H [Thermoanaerobaculia bacterium]|nr:NADH-quinone oxidoreductase subunit H [Thermoanaerobaculia bacterium]
MVNSIANLLVVLAIAPLLPGVINKTKALVAGRKGPPAFQVYYDLVKLLGKGLVVSRTTTWVFLAGPVLSVAAPIVAVLLLPLAGRPGWLSFEGDMILFVGVFALARFFVAAAAMDTGSPFEGMGAAREVTFSALAEPAVLFGMLALTRLSGSLSLTGMLDIRAAGAWQKASASVVLVLASWFLVLLAENSRVPFDDPNTHLELTMIHEVMVLDHAGPAFGFVLYGAALKLAAFSALLVTLLIPARAGGGPMDLALFVAGLAGVAVVVGLVESSMARLRLVRVPQLLVTATLLAGFAVVLLVR